MRVYVCLWKDRQGELTYATSFIDRAKARKWFIDIVAENTHGSLRDISLAVKEAIVEFDNYVPRCMDAEAETAIVKVIETED